MKKYIIYIVILGVGLFLGKLFFGNSSVNDATHNHKEEKRSQLWTCSMHPQILQPEEGQCPICGMDLIPAESSADGLEADQFKLTENAMALANIQTTIVGSESNMIDDNEVKLSGKIVENEDNLSIQTAHFSGRIERFYIGSVGEKVNRGQLLARIYSPELYAAQQELLTASSLRDLQPALYKAVRGKLRLWKLSEKQINSIETSGKPITNFPIYSNVSGIVTEKMVEEGNHVMEGAPLLKISNLNTIWANFDVYENQISLFKKGQEVTITSNAYPSKEFNTKISFIDPILDIQTRTVKLRAVLNNKDGIFKPGMFVEGKIKLVKSNSSKEQSIIIPSTAVLWTGKRSVVYIKSTPDEPVFEMRKITLGSKMGKNYEVLKGLKEGDEIVTNGTFTIDATAQLQGKKSMMNDRLGDGSVKDEEENEVDRIVINPKFKKQLDIVFQDYIALKDAFVLTDAKKVSELAKQTLVNLQKVKMSLLKKPEAHKVWMAELLNIKSSLESIQKGNDIENQRTTFIKLSNAMIVVAKSFGVNKTIHVQYCPMANNNKGADWLSTEKEIKNPYFGDKMLNCGSIKEIIE